MKPIFPVNLCKLVDKLFTEFPNADTIRFAVYGTDRYLSIGIIKKEEILSNISLYEDKYMNDMRPRTAYTASKQDGKINYFVSGFEAVSELELEKSMEKLRAIINCHQEGGMMLLHIDDKLLETLKLLDSVF